MRKKIKYRLGITTYNSEPVHIYITKENYKNLVIHYKELVSKNNLEYKDGEYRVEFKSRTFEFEKYIEHVTEFQDGATYITLSMLECKDGYTFKR